MAIYLNGTLIAQTNKVFFNGVQLSSTGKVYGNGTQVWMGGTLTLLAQVFNASGTFTMPSGVVNNQVIVACTGGGGGGGGNTDGYSGGGGSGRTFGSFTLTPSETASIVVGAGGAFNVSSGGTSSFKTLTCSGGGRGYYNAAGAGVNGGGNGGRDALVTGTASNCSAILSLTSGAVDNTGGLYLAKSFAGGAGTGYGGGGGGGCYAVGGSAAPNSGAGGYGYGGNGGSGKVVVFYYKYV